MSEVTDNERTTVIWTKENGPSTNCVICGGKPGMFSAAGWTCKEDFIKFIEPVQNDMANMMKNQIQRLLDEQKELIAQEIETYKSANEHPRWITVEQAASIARGQE